MQTFPAIAVPFHRRLNYFSSTFGRTRILAEICGFFCVRKGRREPVRSNRWMCKKVLILRNSYNFREASGNLANLLGVTNLMSSKHLEPFIDVEHAEKSVRPAIDAQI